MKHLWILIALLLFGCSDSGPPVHFIVSDNFHGEITLTPDSSAPPIPSKSGHYEILIPPSGIVSFKDLSPLEVWHTSVPMRASGKSIPWPGHVGADEISWHGSSTSGTGETRYFVGTLKEYYIYEGWESRLKELEGTEQGGGEQSD